MTTKTDPLARLLRASADLAAEEKRLSKVRRQIDGAKKKAVAPVDGDHAAAAERDAALRDLHVLGQAETGLKVQVGVRELGLRLAWLQGFHERPEAVERAEREHPKEIDTIRRRVAADVASDVAVRATLLSRLPAAERRALIEAAATVKAYLAGLSKERLRAVATEARQSLEQAAGRLAKQARGLLKSAHGVIAEVRARAPAPERKPAVAAAPNPKAAVDKASILAAVGAPARQERPLSSGPEI